MHGVQAEELKENPGVHFVHVVELLHSKQSEINEEQVWHVLPEVKAYPESQ